MHDVRRLRIGRTLELRLYRPLRPSEALAGIVYLHGGGWVLGDLDLQDATCRHLANVTGALTAAVAYRLAPEHPYPAPLDDACTAIEWLYECADQLGVERKRIGVAGSSAGANLAAASVLRRRDEGAVSVAAQLLLYPPTDPLMSFPSVSKNGTGYYLTAEDMRGFIEAYLPDPETRTNPYAAPLYAESLKGLPPAVVTTAGFDPLCDEGVAYVQRLQDAGIDVEHLHYPGLIHGYFGFADRVPAAAAARDEVLRAFTRLLSRPM